MRGDAVPKPGIRDAGSEILNAIIFADASESSLGSARS